MKKISLFVLAACLLTAAYAQEVTIPGSQVRTIRSAIVGQDYVLHVSLPGGYASGSKKYPVVYLMDSQWDFPLLTAIYGEQYYDGFVPELIIVGVTWGGANPRPDSLRARDYTPTHQDQLPQSGGAAAFLSFMKNELFPFVEANYRADPNDRALAGCSFGGLFTLFALFTEPGLFRRYIAASPAFEWDNEVIYRYEKAYFEKQPAQPARLYMTMGGVERGLPGFEKLTKHLSGRHYPSLQLQARVLENTGHSGTKAETYARGLQYVFERPRLTLDAALLNSYAGNYESGIVIKNENNRLVAYEKVNNSFPLYAASSTDFYSTSEFLNIHFVVREAAVDGFQLEGYGNSRYIKRIK